MNILLKQRNFKSMIRVVKEDLSRFLGFRECNFLFYSDQKQELYTIQDTKNQEEDADEEFVLST
jgi:hypothetical protein